MNNRTLYKKIGKLNNNIPHNKMMMGRKGMKDVIGGRLDIDMIPNHFVKRNDDFDALCLFTKKRDE